MAIATISKDPAKEALLAKINTLVWALQYLSAWNTLPSKEHLALKFPQLSREKLLFYLGCKTEDEVIEKLGQLRLKFEALQQTLVKEANTLQEVKELPPEALQSGVFAGKSEGEVGKSIVSSLSEVQKEPAEEELKLIEPAEPAERKTISATLVDPHASFSPTHNEAAEILAQVGLIDENGEPKPDYKNLLSNPEFKKEVERKLQSAILAQELESQIIDLLDQRFASTQVPHEAIQKEFNFAKKEIASQYVHEALFQLSAAGEEAASLSQASQAAKGVIQAKIEKDKSTLPGLFNSLLAANLSLEKNEPLRKEVVDKLTNATLEALGTFSPNQNVWLSLGADLPRVSSAHYFLDEKSKLKRNLYEYWVLPKTPEVQEKEIEEERNDQEVMLASFYKATSTIPNPNVAKYVGQERPKPKTYWPYFVGAPLYAGWFVTDPVGAIAAIPYGTTAIATYIGAAKIKAKVKAFKLKLQPFLNPGEYLRRRYSETVQRLLFQQIPARAIRMTPLYKNYDIKGPDGRTYQYAEFRPARFLRVGTGKVLEKFAGTKIDSIKYRVLTRAQENITPKVNLRTKKVEKKHNGLLGVIIGIALVDVLAGAIWEYAKNRVVMLAKIERVLGPAGRIGKSAFSLNTAAGAYAGFMLGVPFGLSVPLAVAGGVGGWSLQAFKDFAKDPGFLARQIQREQLLAEGKLVSRWERAVTRVGKVPRIFSQNPPLSNIPLKGTVLGYMIGGVPGAVTWGSFQILWSNRGWMASQFGRAVDNFVYERSGRNYVDLSHLAETGPRWAKPLKYTRYFPKYLPGAGVGGAIGFIASGGGIQGLLVGATIGYGIHTGASLTLKAIAALTRAARQAIAHQIRMFYIRYPYAKGAILGLGLGAVFITLGIHPLIALSVGIMAGIATQYLWKKLWGLIAGRAGERFAASALGQGLLARFAVPSMFVKKLGGRILLLGLGRDLLGMYLDVTAENPQGLRKYVLRPFAKLLYKALDIILWPVDKLFAGLYSLLAPILGPLLGKIYLGLYEAGKFLFGWTTKLPGFLGGWAGKAGGFFGAIKEAITGGIQAALNIIMGLLGGLIQLLMGGDIAEAALAAAIGLTLAGSFINSQTIESAFTAQPTAYFGPGTPGQQLVVDLSKLAQVPALNLGPNQTVSFDNDKLPQQIEFQVKVKAKNMPLVNLNCADQLTLTKTDKTKESLPIPPIPPCPSKLDPGQEFAFSFSTQAQNESKFFNSLMTNTFFINGIVQAPSGLDFYIPFRDTAVRVVNPADVQARVNNRWPNNMMSANCPTGPCWDYVISQSISQGVNPAFVIAIWIEESGASHYPGHFSCPAGGVGLSRTVNDLVRSLNCFLDLANDYSTNQFAQTLAQFCGPNQPIVCGENDNFLAALQDWYNIVVPPGNYGELQQISGPTTNTPFSTSVSAYVRIGSPPTTLPQGWPTSGGITQGPRTGNPGHGEAIDIGNSVGTPICATHDGEAKVYREGDPGIYGTGGLGNYVAITANDGSFTSFYGHLRKHNPFAISDGPVTAGTLIGYMGETGVAQGPHIHYQFWGLRMGPPNIPQEIPSGSWNSWDSPYQVVGCQ
jgi:hypothetical protein